MKQKERLFTIYKPNMIVLLLLALVLVFTARVGYSDGFIINSGLKLDINDIVLNVNGSMTVSGNLESGNGTITVSGNLVNTGTITASSGFIEFTGLSGTQTFNPGSSGSVFNNVTYSGTSTLTLANNIDINGAFLNKTGAFDAGLFNMNIAGDWNNEGTFLPGSSTVTFDGVNQTIKGSNTFYNLAKVASSPVTLTFEGSKSQTITNNLILQGIPGVLISLRSDASPTQFKIAVTETGRSILSFLDVKDSDASGGKLLEVGDDSVDSGNNTNWQFFVPTTPTPPPAGTPVPTPPGGGGGGGGPVATPAPTPAPAPSGSIIGNVADSKLRPIKGIFVDAYDFFSGLWIGGAKTDELGDYTITNIAAGTYKVGVDVSDTAFVEQFFNKANWATADKVIVTETAGRSGINFILTNGNFIRGKVSDSASNPVPGIFVDAFDSVTREWVSDSLTDGQGNYSITVPPGSYKVAVNTLGTDFLREFFLDSGSFEDALEIVVTANKNAENKNFSLSKGNTIKGQITDIFNNKLQGVFVNVFDASSGELVNFGETDSDGNYEVAVLPGRYNVVVEVFGTNFSPAIRESVVVKSNGESPIINFILNVSNFVKGKVASSTGAPLANIFIEALNSETGVFVDFGVTGLTGEYSIPLHPGGYTIKVNTDGTNFLESSQDINMVASDVTVDFTLKFGNLIHGNVTDSSNAPVFGVTVNAFDFKTGVWAGAGATDINGDYSIPVVPGSYKVGIDPFGTNFAPIFYDNVDWDNAESVTVFEVGDTLDINIVVPEGSFIEGKVTAGSNPISGVIVEVYDFQSDTWINSDKTDNDGNYSVPVMAGLYKVGTFALKQGFADEFYNNTGVNFADKVTVIPGKTVSRINFELDPGGSISGLVTNGSTPIKDIEVNAFEFETNRWVSSGLTDADGNYKISGLTEGNYRVWAFDPDGFTPPPPVVATPTPQAPSATPTPAPISGGTPTPPGPTPAPTPPPPGPPPAPTPPPQPGGPPPRDPLGFTIASVRPEGRYTSKFFNNGISWSQATPVAVVNGADTPNIDINLSLGGKVSGKVLNSKDFELSGIVIEAYESDTGLWINSVTTDLSGNYTISLRPNADYKLKAFDPNVVHNALYYQNVSSWHQSDRIHIDPADNKSGFDFSMVDDGGFISGKVTDEKNRPVREVEIGVFNFDTGSWFDSTITDVDGLYKIVVPSGKYKVGALPVDSKSLSTFYNNASNWKDAEAVFVPKTQGTGNINFKLFKGGNIEGLVKDKSDNALPQINIQVFDFATGSWVNESITDKEGKYNVAVPAGKYKIRAEALDVKSKFAGQFYKNAFNWNQSEPVAAANDATTTLDDIELTNGSSISGKVVDGNSLPLSNAKVDIYEFDTGFWVASTSSDKNGDYTVKGLPNNDFRVKASPPPGRGLSCVFYNNAVEWDNAWRAVINNKDLDNINFTLVAGGLILGKVSDDVTGDGISGVEVGAYDFGSGSWVGSGITDGNGDYSIQAPFGVYLLHTAASGIDYVDEFYDNTLNLDEAKPAIVTATKNFNANFQLGTGGKISGKISDFENEDIFGAKISAFNFGTDLWVNSGLTNIDGEFTINVPVGKYRLEVNAPVNSDLIDASLDSPIKVGEDENVTIAGIALQKGRGSVIGIVKDDTGPVLEGIKVIAVNAISNAIAGSDVTDSKGAYKISVPPGSYRIKTVSGLGDDKFVDKLFDNVISWDDASLVNVSKDVLRTVDFVLNKGVKISGRVRKATGSIPLPGLEVHVLQSDTGKWINSGKTDGNGNYSITVPDGVYRIWADNKGVNVNSQFFSSTKSFDKAKRIVVSGTDIKGVDFDLTSK